METIKDRIIQGESLPIDDMEFIDCTLVDCVLEYSGGPLHFERTELRGCRYVFYGRAKRTVHFLQETGLMPYRSSEWGEISGRVQ